MSQRKVVLGYQLRDPHGASRSVASLMLASAPFVFVTSVVLHPNQQFSALVAMTVTSVVVGAGGWVCWTHPHVMPRLFWLVAPFLATVLITGIDLVTRDASTGAQLFYLWPALYAASFLGRRMIYLSLLVLFGNEAFVVFLMLDKKIAGSDFAAMALAFIMIIVVVVALRDRADQLRVVLEKQARMDALTGLANRRSFDEEMARAAAWASHNGERLALLTVDVDHFKRINDTWGHAAGDRALQAVAGALRSVASRADDLVARLGGDEFVVVLRCDRPRALWAAEAVRTAVAAIDVLAGGPPSVSVGVAVMPDDGSTVEALLAASDAALYEAKSRGRGRVVVAQ